MKADHVVSSQEGTFECRHCGARQPMALPCDFDVYLAAGEAFLRKHRGCQCPGVEKSEHRPLKPWTGGPVNPLEGLYPRSPMPRLPSDGAA